MVLLSLAPTDPPPAPASISTLKRWHDEICAYEMQQDGMVHRGGRWLQRLEKGRQAAWQRSLESKAPADRGATRLKGDAKRIAAQLHRLEATVDPSDRAILQRATQEERVSRLLTDRMTASLEPDVAAALTLLDEKRRSALLRPGVAAVQRTSTEDDGAGASSRPSSPATPQVFPMGGAAAATSSSTGALTAAESMRAAMDWDEACQALSEEWQLYIEATLRRERSRVAQREDAALAGAPADGSPHRSAAGAQHVQILLEEDESTCVCSSSRPATAAVAARRCRCCSQLPPPLLPPPLLPPPLPPLPSLPSPPLC